MLEYALNICDIGSFNILTNLELIPEASRHRWWPYIDAHARRTTSSNAFRSLTRLHSVAFA